MIGAWASGAMYDYVDLQLSGLLSQFASEKAKSRNYYHDYCKTTAIIQVHFTQHSRAKRSQRMGRPTIIDVARCMPNGTALPKSFWGKIAVIAAFLLNRPLLFGGDTRSHKVFRKHVNLTLLWAIRTRPKGGREAHLALYLRLTRSPHHLQSQKKLRAHWLLRRFIRRRQPGECEVYIREHIFPLWGVIHFSARIFCNNNGVLLLAGQTNHRSWSKHLAIRFLGVRDWIINDKLVIDRTSTKDQLSDIFFLRSYFWMNRRKSRSSRLSIFSFIFQ